MAVTRKLRRSGIDLRDRKALLAHNPAPEETVAEAVRIVDLALMQLGLGASTMSSILYSRCHYHVPTTAIPTAAVTLLADGTAMLLYNPEFIVDLDVHGSVFVLAHEARHVIMRHLFNEPYLRSDPVFTTATEACINHTVMLRLQRSGLPEATVEVADVKTGKVTKKREKTGVDPRTVYKAYTKDLGEQGLTPVSYEEFIRTDFGCYHELKRMAEPPGSGGMGTGAIGECIHQGDEDGDGDGSSQDGETAEELGKDVLNATMKAAMAGKRDAREELIELGDRTDGATERTSKIWGSLGLDRLRGTTSANRRVDWWKQWFNNTLASKIQPGERLIYVKKRGAVDAVLDLDPILMRRGDDELKVVLICLDTSGSMPQHVIDYLTKLVGYTDGVEAHWLAFDGKVVPFVPGEGAPGGGGTDFGNVMEYAEGRLEVNGQKLSAHPDAVVMLTDGYASPIRPAEPDKWMWLITEGGSDDWIRAQSNPMESYQLQTGEGLS